MTIHEFIITRNISMTAERTGRNPNMNEPGMTHWKCKLTRKAVVLRMSVVFSMGSGHKLNPPTAADVLTCLASDANSVEQALDFDEWADDMGMVMDSAKERRDAKRTYDACQKQGEKLTAFLGADDMAILMYDVEPL